MCREGVECRRGDYLVVRKRQKTKTLKGERNKKDKHNSGNYHRKGYSH